MKYKIQTAKQQNSNVFLDLWMSNRRNKTTPFQLKGTFQIPVEPFVEPTVGIIHF